MAITITSSGYSDRGGASSRKEKAKNIEANARRQHEGKQPHDSSGEKWSPQTNAQGDPTGKYTNIHYMQSRLDPNSPENQPGYLESIKQYLTPTQPQGFLPGTLPQSGNIPGATQEIAKQDQGKINPIVPGKLTPWKTDYNKASGFEKALADLHGIMGTYLGITGFGMFGALALTGGPIAIAAAGLVGGIVGADTLTNWAALDNVMGQSAIMTSTLAKDMGSANPAQRQAMIQAAEIAQKNAEVARTKIITSTMIDPAMYPFAKIWKTATDQAYLQIQNNLFAMKNYNPLQDTWSLESQQAKNIKDLQTYGKPQYDEQGNPLK